MEFALQSMFNSWVTKHPLIMWLLQHPIISSVGFLLTVFLVFRLFSAIAFLLDRFWIWLLRSPFLLIKSLLRIKGNSVKKTTVITHQKLTIEPEKINKIVEQLERIDRQQQQIIKDIAILKQQKENSLIV